MNNKFKLLKSELIKMAEHGICLAFSGGVDSSLLLYLCKNLNITAVTFKTLFLTDDEINNTIKITEKYSVKHIILEVNPLDNENIINNPPDRCYHCKYALFSRLKDFCAKNNIKYIIDGTNADDLNTYRPGLKALKELDIISPFAKFNITKEEIRNFAKELELEFYNKPAVPCIATRFPYNTRLEDKKIETVKQGENILKKYGFSALRVRMHADIARIEVPKEDFDKLLKLSDSIIEKFKKIGFNYITLDLEGLRSGSMDKNLNKQ